MEEQAVLYLITCIGTRLEKSGLQLRIHNQLLHDICSKETLDNESDLSVLLLVISWVFLVSGVCKLA